MITDKIIDDIVACSKRISEGKSLLPSSWGEAVELLKINSETLKSLEKISKTLTNDDARELAGALEKNTHLEELILDDTQIGPAGAKALAAALAQSSSIKTFGLGHSPIGDDGAASLIRAATENKNLKKLILCYCDLTDAIIDELVQLIEQNKSLEKILIHGNHISNEGARRLAEALSNNKQVRTLRLNCVFMVSITDPVILARITALTDRNKELNPRGKTAAHLYAKKNLITIRRNDDLSISTTSPSKEAASWDSCEVKSDPGSDKDKALDPAHNQLDSDNKAFTDYMKLFEEVYLDLTIEAENIADPELPNFFDSYLKRLNQRLRNIVASEYRKDAYHTICADYSQKERNAFYHFMNSVTEGFRLDRVGQTVLAPSYDEATFDMTSLIDSYQKDSLARALGSKSQQIINSVIASYKRLASIFIRLDKQIQRHDNLCLIKPEKDGLKGGAELAKPEKTLKKNIHHKGDSGSDLKKGFF